MGKYYEKTWKNSRLMDPVNIIVLLNVAATFGANLSGAKRSFRSKIGLVKEKPPTFLQSVPVYIAVVSTIILILAVFRVGTLNYETSYLPLRIVGLVVYLIFSWIQVKSVNTLGENHSQEILIYKNHSLVQQGIYKIVRHPQYLSQFLIDLGGGIALMSYLLVPIAIIELPLLIMRAYAEEKLLTKYFKQDFEQYKKHTGFMIPFIG